MHSLWALECISVFIKPGRFIIESSLKMCQTTTGRMQSVRKNSEMFLFTSTQTRLQFHGIISIHMKRACDQSSVVCINKKNILVTRFYLPYSLIYWFLYLVYLVFSVLFVIIYLTFRQVEMFKIFACYTMSIYKTWTVAKQLNIIWLNNIFFCEFEPSSP